MATIFCMTKQKQVCRIPQQHLSLQGVEAAHLQRAQMYDYRRLFQLLGALPSAPVQPPLLDPCRFLCPSTRVDYCGL